METNGATNEDLIPAAVHHRAAQPQETKTTGAGDGPVSMVVVLPPREEADKRRAHGKLTGTSNRAKPRKRGKVTFFTSSFCFSSIPENSLAGPRREKE